MMTTPSSTYLEPSKQRSTGSLSMTLAYASTAPTPFFFFQAEDGIRVLTVTGVQTCALPISTPHDAHGRQHAQMLQAQPECGGANGEDAEQDQAIDATDAALQGIWDDSEAITVHEDSTDRVGESDAREDGSQQQWCRDEAIERPEQYEHDQGTAQREAYAYAPLQRRAEYRAKQVPDTATCDDQAVEHGRDMLLLHNGQDEKHAGCYG